MIEFWEVERKDVGALSFPLLFLTPEMFWWRPREPVVLMSRKG